MSRMCLCLPGRRRPPLLCALVLASALLAAAPRALAQQEGVATYRSGDTTWTLTGPTVVTEGSVAEYTVGRTAGDAPLDVRVGIVGGLTVGLARLARISSGQCASSAHVTGDRDRLDACLEVPSGATAPSWNLSWHGYSLGNLPQDGHVMRVHVRQDNTVDPGETLRVGFGPGNSAASSDWSFTVTIRNGDRDGTVTMINRHTTASVWDLGRALTAMLADPDGIDPGSVLWQWQRNPAPDLSQDWVDIADATSRTYVPGREDMETGLRAQASYGDLDGPGKSAAHPGRPVQGICGRTQVIRDAILGEIPGSPRCQDVRLSDLAAIDTQLDFPNSVDTLRDFDFFGMSSLRGLRIRSFDSRRPGLSTLPPQALEGLGGLVTLNLSNNRLTALQEGVFAHVPNLEVLFLDNNRLTALPPGLFADITGVATLSFYRNRLESVSDDTFDHVEALDTLDLRWNNLDSIPEGFFLGHSRLSTVRMHLNPGDTGNRGDVPFELTVRLERSDGLPWTAPGPATVSVRIAEGAPGPITATLWTSGDLSLQTAVIPAGAEASGPVTLTPPAGETHARVFIDAIRNITSEEICRLSVCYGGGIRLAKGNAELALPTTVTVRDQTWTAGTPVSLPLPLPVGGDGALTHAITPPLPEGVTLDGREISGTPRTARPAQAHEWTATDSTGSVTLAFSLTVNPGVPAPPENLRAIGGVEQVTLEWDAGADRGATVTLWQYRMSDDDGERWTEWADIPGGAATAHTVTGLAAGPTRVFEVRARNSVGDGPAAQATAPPVAADIEPTFAGATVADQMWSVGTAVSLALPMAIGGNPPLVTVLAPALPAGISVNGRDVSGTPSAVTAEREHTWTFTDADGDAVSLAFRVAVAPGRPGAPVDFRASSGLDRRAGLSWSPGPDNGAAIDLWQLRVSDDNGGSWTDWADIPGGAAARTHTVTGLAPVQNTIELRARNSAGFGPAAQANATPVELDTVPTFGGVSVADQSWTVGTPVSLTLPDPPGGNLPYRRAINPPLPAGVSLSGRTVSGTPLATAAAQAHTLTVTDADGDTVPLTFTIAVSPGAPAAPTNLSATAGTLEVTLDWDAGPDNGATVELWQYRVSDGPGGPSGWTNIPRNGADTGTVTVTGLAASIEHTFEVRASNSVGLGPPASAAATPLNTPPTFGAETVDNQDWTVGTSVSLDLPEASGGNGALTYSLSPALPANVTRNGRTVSGTPVAAATGREYAWTATDARGDAVSLAFMVAVAPDVPGAPENLVATAGTLEVTLGWDAGPDNGATVDLWQYRVSDGPGGPSGWTGIPRNGADTGTVTVTGLAASIEHTFEVRASNSVGFGPPASVTATPLNTPPTFGAETIDNQDWTVGTTVSLELPEASGGNGTLTYSLSPALPANVTRNGRTVSGTPVAVATGQEYAWTATDARDDTVSLTFMVAVAPGRPGAPVDFLASSGLDRQAGLSWSPGPDNGAAIDLWQFRVSNDNGGSWTEWADIPGGAAARSHTATGLAAVPNTIELRARNSVGFGPPASAAATPVELDTEPTFGGASVDDQSWTVGTPVSLTLPDPSGGNLPYRHTINPPLPTGVSLSGRTVSGTPLATAAAQAHTLTATDADGDAVPLPLTFTVAVTAGVPGAPTNLSATAGTLEVTLDWDAGADNGATTDLWQYRVSVGTGWSPDWTDVPASDADTDTHTVTGLAANVEHTFQVRASNSVGFGPPASAAATPLNTPPTFGAETIDNQDWTVGTSVSLDLPEASGGNGALTYSLSPALPANVTRNGRTVSGTAVAVATGREYTWTATDARGDAVSLAFMVAVAPDVPGAPVDFLASSGLDRQAGLSWNPGPDNGAAVDLWQFRVSDDNGGSWTEWADIPGGAATRSHTVTGLVAVLNTIELRARNSAGFGPAARATATPVELDTEPAFGGASVADQSWTVGTPVSLTLPDPSGGNLPYRHTINPPLPTGVSLSGRTVSGTPLATAAAQAHTLAATDADGDTVPLPLTFTVAVTAGVPGAPTNLSATAGTLEVTLGWDAGPDNGATVDLWQYRVSGGPGGPSGWTDIPRNGADTGTVTVTGLAASIEHAFEVRASNSVGFGPPASAAATPLNTPPTFGAETVDNQDWTVGTAVSIELPEASDGNGALTYSLSPALPANVTRNGRTVSGTPVATATGQEYAWTATDARGDAVSLTFMVAVAPGRPGAPVNFLASSGLDRQAGLSWSPGPDNGAAIDLWQFRVSDDNGGSWTEWADIPGGAAARAHTVTGLAPVLNTIELRASNSVGFGPPASAAATPVELDTEPTFGGASVDDQGWTVGTPVSLTLPDPSGGNLPYRHTINPPLPTGVSLSGRIVSGTPLATAAAQAHTLTATDTDGDTVPLTFTVAVTAGVPGAPANLSATAGTLEVTLDWDAGPDNGATVDLWQYRVSGDPGGPSGWTGIPGNGADTGTVTVTGLAASIEHTFEVRASNSVGFGPPASAAATPLNTPPTFGAETVDNQDWTVGTSVSLDLPGASGGNGALTYSLDPELPADVTRNGRTVSGTPTVVATGREHTWTATDARGDAVSLPFTIAVADIPGAPENLVATAGTLEVTLSWGAGPDNGATIDLWQHRVSVSGDTDWSDWETIPASDADTDTHTVPGLVANVEHTFEVRPRNSVGFGPAAAATAMPSVNLRLLPRVANDPTATFGGDDALLIFYFTQFNGLLSRPSNIDLSRIIVRGLARGGSLPDDEVDQIIAAAVALGAPGGIPASHPANLYDIDPFNQTDALLLFYSIQFGGLLTRPALADLMEIVVNGVLPRGHGMDRGEMRTLVLAGMGLVDT